jgi:diguanylate cyclase (GGDEF)-like protein
VAHKMPQRTDRGRSELFVRLVLTAFGTAFVMFTFELTKQMFSPHIAIWTSHAVTILFTSLVATVAAYIMGKKLASTNAELEARISERTGEITEANRKLAVESRQINTLSQMGELLQTCRSLEEISTVIRQFAEQIFPADSGTVWAISESRNIVEATTSWGGSSPAESVFAPEDCWALRQGRPHLVLNASALLCRHINPNASFPTLCVPLTAHSETLGLLYIQNGPNASEFANVAAPSESKQQFAIAMAGHIALALANLRLSEKLRNQSIRDPLTGLFNRRYMEESLERELRRAIRNNESVALLMIDIDHFKQFNDTFGHQAGDTLLREFGSFLRQRTRGQDVACRFGGEEFVIILSASSLDGASQRAEGLREELKQLVVQHVGQVLGALSISIGVSAFPSHGSSAEELLHAADQALYRAKSEGRDKVVLA